MCFQSHSTHLQFYLPDAGHLLHTHSIQNYNNSDALTCHPAHLSVVDHWKQRSPIPLTLPLAHLLNHPPWSPPCPCLYKRLSPTTDSLLANHILLGVYLPCFQLPQGLRLMLQLHVPVHAGEYVFVLLMFVLLIFCVVDPLSLLFSSNPHTGLMSP